MHAVLSVIIPCNPFRQDPLLLLFNICSTNSCAANRVRTSLTFSLIDNGALSENEEVNLPQVRGINFEDIGDSSVAARPSGAATAQPKDVLNPAFSRPKRSSPGPLFIGAETGNDLILRPARGDVMVESVVVVSGKGNASCQFCLQLGCSCQLCVSAFSWIC